MNKFADFIGEVAQDSPLIIHVLFCFLDLLTFICIRESLLKCMGTICMPGICRGLKRTSGALEQTVVSHHLGPL